MVLRTGNSYKLQSKIFKDFRDLLRSLQSASIDTTYQRRIDKAAKTYLMTKDISILSNLVETVEHSLILGHIHDSGKSVTKSCDRLWKKIDQLQDLS